MIKSIKELLSKLPREDRSKEFNAIQILDSNIQELSSRIDKLEAKNLRHFAFAYTQVATVIGIGATVTIPLELTLYPQFGNMHSNVNDPDKIFIRRAGVYNAVATLALAATTVGNGNIVIRLLLFRNGILFREHIVRSFGMIVGDLVRLCSNMQAYCYADDYFQLQASNNTLAAVELSTTATIATSISVSERLEDLDPSQYGLQPPILGE